MPIHGTCKGLALLVTSLLAAAGCSTVSNQGSADLRRSASTDVLRPHRMPQVVVPELQLPPDWLNVESTVVSLGEQDLLDRIRYGFAMDDVDHPAIDREEAWFAKHPTYLDRTFRRGERYLYYIISELEARNMPMELALLPVVESAFIATAKSSAAASGLWQFIPSTGKRFGLKQNGYYDGRRDVVESTRAALDYLQFLAEEFDGDWYLAIAAYNTGEANVARAMARNRAKGLPTDFFSLDLARETEAYVPKLLAMRRIVEDPERHGLEFGSMDNQPYFVKVDVGGQIDLKVAAELAGMTQEDFLAINPGFKHSVTDPNGPHHLLIPVDAEEQFLEKLAAMSPAERVPVVYYRVRKGDSLGKIAKRYGMTTKQLRALNGLKSNSVRHGQQLVLRNGNGAVVSINETTDEAPVATTRAKLNIASTGGRTHTVRRGDTLWSIAQRYDVNADALASANNIRNNNIKAGQKLRIPSADGASSATSARQASSVQQPVTYTVRSGDTLIQIAKLFSVDVQQILSWNNLSSPKALRAGQRLVLFPDDSRRFGG